MDPKIILAAVMMSVLPATQGSVVYNETFQGDIDGFGSPPILTLGLGENIILGASHFGTTFSPSFDSDAFGFTIPSGAMLDLNSIVFEYGVVNVFGDIRSLGLSFWIAADGLDGNWSKTKSALSHALSSDGRAFSYIYTDGSNPNTPLSAPPIEDLEFFDVVNSNIYPTRPSAPLRSGLHWLISGGAMSGLGDYGGSWDYAIKLNVVPASHVPAVPEPGSNLALLALGAGGLTLRRRLKRAA